MLLTRVAVPQAGRSQKHFRGRRCRDERPDARPTLYDAWHDIVPVATTGDRGGAMRYEIVGPVCESGDFLGHDRDLVLHEGDLLAILSAGAYGMAMASNYNSRPRAAEVMIDGNITHLIRRREEVAQLFALESTTAVSRARAILVLVAVLATAGGAAWHYSRTEAPTGKKGQASPAVPVKLAKAVMRDMPLTLAITGRTEAYETVTLKSRVEGQVQAVVFAEGQHVRQGDVLLRLDPADFQAKLNQAEANLARSQAQTAKARADVERYVALREKGFVSEEKGRRNAYRRRRYRIDSKGRCGGRRTGPPAALLHGRQGAPLPALSAQNWYSPVPRSRSMKRPWRW
jgi:hypothetical protein